MLISGWRSLMGAMVLFLSLVACGADDGGKADSRPEPQPLRELLASETALERNERCSSAFQDSSGCYSNDYWPLYCTVLDVRRHYELGHFKLRELPKWTVRRLRADGTPQVYNFRKPVELRSNMDPRDPSRRDSDLREWQAAHGMPTPEDPQLACIHGMTQTKIERTEGGLFRNYDPDAMYVDTSE